MPNDEFHKVFLNRIADASTPVTILWGTPGRGKSTYLSYLTEELRHLDKPAIRHHYFLSGDDTADRISYAEITHSLISQLKDSYPESVPAQSEFTDNFHSIITSAAQHFEQQGERLYVLIDGLDHVWRDYQRVDQLNHLFNELMPLPPNVSLVVGTQRVANSQLPNRLLANSSDADWISIPPMDAIAVHQWVAVQDKAGRLIVRGDRKGDERDAVVAEISGAFYAISQGHPLHLIYAFESLTRTGAAFDAEEVLLIPSCPDGDIRKYYANLWDKLSDTGRTVLHGLAGSEFRWPSLGIRQSLGNYDEIGFLLDVRESGILPFHGSIFAYVRDRGDHEERFRLLLPRIVEWLERDAQPYWRWGWLWISRAKLGDFAPLMQGVSRDWAVASLAEGWSERQVIRILEMAEEYAFGQMDLPRAVELRSIKTRVMNAREFQIQDYAKFEEAAIASSENWQQLRNMSDDLAALSDTEVAMLPRAAPKELRPEIADGCEIELARRIDIWLELRHRRDGEFITLAHLYLDVSALTAEPDVDGIWKFLQLFIEPLEHFRYFGKRLAAAKHYEALLDFRSKLMDDKWVEVRRDLDEHILRCACALGADPFLRLGLDTGRLSPLYASWCRFHASARPIGIEFPPVPANLVRERYDYGIDVGLQHLVHALFFSTLSHAMDPAALPAFEYPGLIRKNLGWLGGAFDLVQRIAREVAGGGLPADLSAPFVGAAELDPVFHGRARATESDQAQYRSFTAALRDIAFDLHLIAAAGGDTLVTPNILNKARSSPHWSDELWMEQVVDRGHPLMTTEAADELLASDVARLGAAITIFNERSEAWALRARVAAIHSLPVSATLAARAADCLLGYGYRKDPWIMDIQSAVETVHDISLTPTLDWISALIPIVDQIGEFTDGSGTSHVRSEIIEVVAKTYPDRLAIFFLHHVEEEEWVYADECLRQVAKVSSLDSPEVAALVGTFMDPRVLDALEDRAGDDPLASAMLERQTAFLGGRPTDHSHHYRSTETDFDEPRPVPALRGPDEFGAVVADVSSVNKHRDKKKHYRDWLQMQKEAGKGKQALDSIRKYFVTGSPTYNAEEALDAAFELSLEVEGREVAYDWLVRAHIARHGWQSNWTSREEVMTRLRLVAQHYGSRWKTFLSDTAEPQDFYKKRGYGLTIGTKYLIEFLLLVDQRQLAAKIVDAMVKTIVAEVRDQPIPEALWFH